MTIEGLWDRSKIVNVEELNKAFIQVGAIADFDPVDNKGMRVYDPDTGKIHRSDGTVFDPVVDVDTVATVASLRTLGSGAQQAASGTHIHIVGATINQDINGATISDSSIFGQIHQRLGMADIPITMASRSITASEGSSTVLTSVTTVYRDGTGVHYTLSFTRNGIQARQDVIGSSGSVGSRDHVWTSIDTDLSAGNMNYTVTCTASNTNSVNQIAHLHSYMFVTEVEV